MNLCSLQVDWTRNEKKSAIALTPKSNFDNQKRCGWTIGNRGFCLVEKCDMSCFPDWLANFLKRVERDEIIFRPRHFLFISVTHSKITCVSPWWQQYEDNLPSEWTFASIFHSFSPSITSWSKFECPFRGDKLCFRKIRVSLSWLVARLGKRTWRSNTPWSPRQVQNAS